METDQVTTMYLATSDPQDNHFLPSFYQFPFFHAATLSIALVFPDALHCIDKKGEIK